MSGNGVRVTNRVLFCEKIVVYDMLLSNGDIIYRLRKFSTRVRLEGIMLGHNISRRGIEVDKA